MNFLKKKFAWVIIYTILLTSFTIYVLLDTFIIRKVHTQVPSENNNFNFSDKINLSENENNEPKSAVITKNSYSDDNINITVTEYREYNTTIYAADITVSSVEYLQTAFANNSYGKNITATTSEIAEGNNAILAINGDFYGSQTTGYVIRNGILYRDIKAGNQEDLVIYKDGSFQIIMESDISAAKLIENSALHVLSFGPAIIIDGDISVLENEEVNKAMTNNPRTAIGIIDERHYVLLVSDGRTDESKGLTLYQLAEFMQKLEADIAYNLDGGGSSTMYFNGNIINKPTTNGNTIKERKVSDIVYIGY